MSKIFEIKEDVHCPLCGAKINKTTCTCTACNFNALAKVTCFEPIAHIVPKYQDSIFSYCDYCIKTGKYTEAAFYYQMLAKHFQDTTAMYKLGQIFLYGAGVDPNADMALKCFEKAALLAPKETHNPSAIMLGELYYYGKYGFPNNKKLSWKWLCLVPDDKGTEPLRQKLSKHLFYDKNEDNLTKEDLEISFSTHGMLNLEDEHQYQHAEYVPWEVLKNWKIFGGNSISLAGGKINQDYQREIEQDYQWEIEQDDSMLHASDRDYYYDMYYGDGDYDDDYGSSDDEYGSYYDEYDY